MGWMVKNSKMEETRKGFPVANQQTHRHSLLAHKVQREGREAGEVGNETWAVGQSYNNL